MYFAMNAIVFQSMEERIRFVCGMISDMEQKLAENPDDFGTRLSLTSMRAHLEELKNQVSSAQSAK
jgi:hypothetical protein